MKASPLASFFWPDNLLVAAAASTHGDTAGVVARFGWALARWSGKALAIAVSTACGSSDANPATADIDAAAHEAAAPEAGVDAPSTDATLPPIAPSKLISDLSAEEKGQLCDWSAALQGGYGTVTVCSDGSSVMNSANRESCVATFMFRCPVTVSQFETCTLAEVPSRGCTLVFEQCRALVCQ